MILPNYTPHIFLQPLYMWRKTVI